MQPVDPRSQVGLLRWAAPVAAAMMFGLALFEAALAAGQPWGAVAWGGGDTGVLGTGLRVATAAAAIFWAGAALVVLRGGGHRVAHPRHRPTGPWVRWARQATGARPRASAGWRICISGTPTP